jgi:hypothetical protein
MGNYSGKPLVRDLPGQELSIPSRPKWRVTLQRSTPVIKFVFGGGKGNLRVSFWKGLPPLSVIYCLYVGKGEFTWETYVLLSVVKPFSELH